MIALKLTRAVQNAEYLSSFGKLDKDVCENLVLRSDRGSQYISSKGIISTA